MKRIFLKYSLFIFLLAAIGCEKDESTTPVIETITPDSGPGGEVIAVTGSGLKDVVSIVFDNQDVPAGVNPSFVTDNAIIFRVPDTAFGGQQNIVFTKKDGSSVSIPFSVIALPSIASVDKYDFEEGTTLVFEGNNFDDVSAVTLDATGQQATIISQSRKEIEIEMPASTADYTKLTFTNASGNRTTTQDFVYVPNHFNIWLEDWEENGAENWSWGGDFETSTEKPLMGLHSIRANMVGSDWGAFRFNFAAVPAINLAPYSYISLYVYGGPEDARVKLAIDGNGTDAEYVIGANKWNYFKIPLQPYKNASPTGADFVFQIQGAGHLFYIDNVLLLK